ncbi:MAG TPA: leucine--tRNA ligase [Dehalococcoidia bacterium]|nr:leucine--tRNA ligase [Dehalococcoidia bacterium]
MAAKYIPQEIEKKWQEKWAETGLYRVTEDSPKPKYYALTMFPYTSGDLHIGHWYAMAPSDAQARFKRMQGYNVLHPMGFDAFGLNAENAAIKQGIHPYTWTMQNIENMRRQLKSIGAIYDWDREVITCLPEYYKWTQWFFLKLYEHDLAYRAKAPVNWCPSCQTVLANEQVIDGLCERCDTAVVHRDLEQWFFRITKYADELKEHVGIDWPERIKIMQRNWVGRSTGTEISFALDHPGADEKEIRVFTTRPDTTVGVTFMVLAPEHPLVPKLTVPERKAEVEAYIERSRRQTEIERLSTEKEKDGVFLGSYVTNRLNGEKVPIWIADYVLLSYGTGAVMAVPAHDERDFAFALKYGLPVIHVIDRTDGIAESYAMAGTMRPGLRQALENAGITFTEKSDGGLYITLDGDDQTENYIEMVKTHLLPGSWTEIVGSRWLFIFASEEGVTVVPFDSIEADRSILAKCKELEPNVRNKRTVMEMLWDLEFYHDMLFHTEYGAMIHSGPLTGTPGDQAISTVTKWMEEHGFGHATVSYRLRDWLISRQRYWGAPIPMIYCDKCGIVPVPEEDLPVLLPEDAEFRPTGESPLSYVAHFVNTTCPKCSGPARRETDTMDTFMCSSWYFLRYCSPHYEKAAFDPEKMKYWMPVDIYTGGAEHAVMHLLYVRFFIKALRDMGIVHFDEPCNRLYNQGHIIAQQQKMSKSRGNVITPDEYVTDLGVDTVRVYFMFLGPWEQGGEWDDSGISGVRRWLNRVWNLVLEEYTPKAESDSARTELQRTTHQTIRKVTGDIERLRFNTMIAALMEFTNYLTKIKESGSISQADWNEAIEKLLLLLAASTPHIAEELWEQTGHDYSIHNQDWPQWDEELAKDEEVTLVVQVNGRLRDRIAVPVTITEEEARQLALESPKAKPHIEGKQLVRAIYVPQKLVNLVVR